MTCPQFENQLCLHPSGDGLYYADFSDDDRLYSDTISSVEITCDDAGVTVSAEAVITSDTVVPWRGGTRTIAANKGVRFRLAGGTAQSDYGAPARLTILCTTAAGYTIAAVGLLLIES